MPKKKVESSESNSDSDNDNDKSSSDKEGHGKTNSMGRPAPPKKPLTAFFLYKADVYEKVKKENPDKKMTELTKIISERWNAADQKTITKYTKQNAVLKEKI